MRKVSGTLITTLAGLVAVGTPILLALHMANQQGKDFEQARALDYARDVLHRSDLAAEQIYADVDRLTAAGESDPCSEAQLAQMRALDISSSYIQAIGYVSGNHMVCSSLGKGSEAKFELGKPDVVTSTGSTVWSNARLPFAPGAAYTIVARNGYAAIINKDLPIDVSTDDKDLSLATITPDNRQIRSVRGEIKPEWIDALHGERETTFVEGNYVVAVTRSVRFATIAVAALRRHEFSLAYQPIVDLQTRRLVGAEALLRWRRPTGETVPTDIFIRVAEDAGLMQRITERVINLLARDAWDFFRRHPHLHLGINLAPADLQSTRTVDLLGGLARAIRARAGNLFVEVTERSLVDADVARENLRTMRANGVRVAIDDFGTGYSSLSYLETFELDYLKIDKSFVDKIGTEAATSQVVTHIIRMAKDLQLQMIAEGVETETQARFLAERGVQFAQGWLFGRPMQFDELESLLSKQTSVALSELFPEDFG